MDIHNKESLRDVADRFRKYRKPFRTVRKRWMKAKRSLGQNFLTNTGIAEKIVALAELAPDDHVVEIGPGRGILTTILAQKAGQLTAVEKDDRFFDMLSELFAGKDHVSVMHADILECDLSRLIRKGTKIVANLPYNIASQVIIRLMGYAQDLSSVVVMVQKEVAERICACPGHSEYSALSVLVSSAFRTIPGMVVGPNNFSPSPKVTSQVIKLVPAEKPVPSDMAGIFRTIVHQAFSQRRKMLKNSLMGLTRMDRHLLDAIARDAGIDLNKRPQDLSVQNYLSLSISYSHRIPLLE